MLKNLIFGILGSIVTRVLYYTGVYFLTIKGVTEAWQVLQAQIVGVKDAAPTGMEIVWREVIQLISIAGIDQAVNMMLGAYSAYFGLAGLVFARGLMMRGSLPGQGG